MVEWAREEVTQRSLRRHGEFRESFQPSVPLCSLCLLRVTLRKSLWRSAAVRQRRFERRHDLVLLLVGHFGVDRQGDHFGRGLFADGEAARFQFQEAIRGLEVQGNRVVYASADALLLAGWRARHRGSGVRIT